MGRTIPTFTRYLEDELASWTAFRRALIKEDREVFDQLFRLAKRHIAAASCATRPVPFDALVMAILLEQQKEIERLKAGGAEAPPAGRALRLIPIFTKGLPQPPGDS